MGRKELSIYNLSFFKGGRHEKDRDLHESANWSSMGTDLFGTCHYF